MEIAFWISGSKGLVKRNGHREGGGRGREGSGGAPVVRKSGEFGPKVESRPERRAQRSEALIGRGGAGMIGRLGRGLEPVVETVADPAEGTGVRVDGLGLQTLELQVLQVGLVKTIKGGRGGGCHRW